jgi:hypothetical protein
VQVLGSHRVAVKQQDTFYFFNGEMTLTAPNEPCA